MRAAVFDYAAIKRRMDDLARPDSDAPRQWSLTGDEIGFARRSPILTPEGRALMERNGS